MSDLDDELIKLWRPPAPDRMANGCCWVLGSIFAIFILTGIAVFLIVKLRFTLPDPLPYGCSVEHQASNGECL